MGEFLEKLKYKSIEVEISFLSPLPLLSSYSLFPLDHRLPKRLSRHEFQKVEVLG